MSVPANLLRPIPLTSSASGISRLRVRGGANPTTLYDLLNGWVSPSKSATMRYGTRFLTTLPVGTKGLAEFKLKLHVFTAGTGSDPTTYPVPAIPVYSSQGWANTGGTLAAGTYTYIVTAVNAYGESLPSLPMVVIVPSGTLTNQTTIYWGAVGGAVSYNIYGRTAGNDLLQANVATAFYVDLGTDVPQPGKTPPVTGPLFVVDILRHPQASFSGRLKYIHFASPFLGYLYVVAEFDNGDVFHYWLQNPQTWLANHQYQVGDLVQPTVPNGYYYKAMPAVNPPAWAPNVSRANGGIVQPTIPNGYKYTVTATNGANPASGAIEPIWPAVDGATVIEFTDAFEQTATPSAPPQPPSNPTGNIYNNPPPTSGGGGGGGGGNITQPPTSIK